MTNTHIPVLAQEVVAAFAKQPHLPMHLFEGTFGRGGHTRLLLDQFPKSRVVSFDKDRSAIDFANEQFRHYINQGRLILIHDDFRNLSKHRFGHFDGALLDLGVSSPQLDEPSRGFSFLLEGSLDMRMDVGQSVTAGRIVNELSEKELNELFQSLGEIRKPQRVVRAIVHDRKKTPFTTTRELASLIERISGRKKRGVHPATQYFMALRIAVNKELEGLEQFILSMPFEMEPGSRFVIISFHSLEDRIAKTCFKEMNRKHGRIINKKVITAERKEVLENPRSRSAKMRIFEMGV